MSAFALDGRLSLDPKDFVSGAKQAQKAVTGIGDELGDLPAEAKKGVKGSTQELGKLPAEGGKIGKLTGGGLGSSLIAGFGALGIGAALTSMLVDGLETERMVNKVNNAFRRTPEEAAEQGKIAGELYAGNWGNSLGELEGQIALTNQRIGDLTTDELAKITTGAIAVADTWDQDFNEVIRAASTLLKNGLAPDAESALDVVTAGFQDGADTAGDWLDTITEYSQHFENIGLSAQDMTTMVTRGFQEGQRDADKLADAIKENFLRVSQGVPEAVAALELIGLRAGDVQDAYIEGGDAGRAAYKQIVDGLNDLRDPEDRHMAMVGLFNTQYEDLGTNALPILSSIADGTEDITGRNQELIEGIDNQVQEWDVLSRRVQAFAAEGGEALAGMLNDVIGALGEWYSLWGDVGEAMGATLGLNNNRKVREYEERLLAAAAAGEEFNLSLLDGVEIQSGAAKRALEEMGVDVEQHATIILRLKEVRDEEAAAIMNGTNMLDANTEATKEAVSVAGESAEATDDATDATEDAAKAQEELTTAIEDAIAALKEQVEAQRTFADSTLNARAKQRDFMDQIDDTTATLADQESSTRDVEKALDDVTSAAADTADANVKLAEDTAAASGAALTATEQQDIWNEAMLDSAATAGGPLSDAIIDYIADVNEIPPEKVSEIKALVAEGELEEAKAALEEASETRETTLLVDAANLTETSKAIDDVAYKQRTATIALRYSSRGGPYKEMLASGTDFAQGGLTLVGEEGPELVNMPRGSKVYTADETRRMLAGAAAPITATTMTGTAPRSPATASTTTGVHIEHYHDTQGTQLADVFRVANAHLMMMG